MHNLMKEENTIFIGSKKDNEGKLYYHSDMSNQVETNNALRDSGPQLWV